MAARRKTGLDFAISALDRHVQALAERQERSAKGELNTADMTSMVRATEVLRAIECDRANLLLKLVGRRITTMPTEELKDLIAQIMTGDKPVEAEDAN